MRGRLPETEPLAIQKWLDDDLHAQILKKNEGRPLFVMPDGPPYANGNLHLGHVLNKILKDIVIKYKNMSGHRAAFIPGWDCHGLPIELKVRQGLGKAVIDKSDAEIRELCRQEALKWVDIQKQQFVRLGVIADWNHPYLTLQPEYEAEEIRVLAKINDNGLFFRGEKPVYWCTKLQTALAAAEVEYHNHKSPSIYVKFYVEKDLERLGLTKRLTAFVIWTTTPWTLPANYGIALNENFTYGVYDSGEENLIIAEDLAGSVSTEIGLPLKKLASFKGRELEGIKARHPFLDRDSVVVLGDHVSLEAGTGCVHTAPGHGLEDYQMGLKYKLPVHSPVGPDGKFTNDVPRYAGMKIWDANKVICDDLKASGHLLAMKEIEHSYPFNPRTNTPLIFRATPQWFIRMDDDDFNLRQLALEKVQNEIRFVPRWGAQRLQAMVSNTPDWCLSRQKVWGVPLPVFYCENCGESLADSKIMLQVADRMESSGKGIEAYHETPLEEWLGDHVCEKCGHSAFRKGQDILDVWFDSGVEHSAVQKKREGLAFPADIYLEGSDQHRGWFQTSLMSSLAAYKQAPYKALITHGFVNDAQGHKMSKSKGNVVDPAEVIKKYGAEILRLWVAYEDYGQDVSISQEMFQRITETYRRIRNTMRFLLGNLYDFSLAEAVAFEQMPILDQWALGRLGQLLEKVEAAYENYDFYKVYHAINQFFTIDLSATYLDIVKDRLYTSKRDGRRRRSTQTVILQLAQTLTVIMAPILSFLAEEVYGILPGSTKHSVFFEDFPKANPQWISTKTETLFADIFAIRAEVAKTLESLRQNKTLGASLEAQVLLTLPAKTFEKLAPYQAELQEILIVSQLELISGETLAVEARKASGEKCQRCWQFSTELGKVESLPGICPKCVEALT